MVMFRCDFNVVADLVLPKELPQLEFTDLNGLTYTFKNGVLDEDRHTGSLLVSVVGPADSIDTAEVEHRAVLSDRLHVLAFVTQSRFAISEAIRVLDWEPGQRLHHEFKVRGPAAL